MTVDIESFDRDLYDNDELFWTRILKMVLYPWPYDVL